MVDGNNLCGEPPAEPEVKSTRAEGPESGAAAPPAGGPQAGWHHDAAPVALSAAAPSPPDAAHAQPGSPSISVTARPLACAERDSGAALQADDAPGRPVLGSVSGAASAEMAANAVAALGSHATPMGELLARAATGDPLRPRRTQLWNSGRYQQLWQMALSVGERQDSASQDGAAPEIAAAAAEDGAAADGERAAGVDSHAVLGLSQQDAWRSEGSDAGAGDLIAAVHAGSAALDAKGASAEGSDAGEAGAPHSSGATDEVRISQRAPAGGGLPL